MFSLVRVAWLAYPILLVTGFMMYHLLSEQPLRSCLSLLTMFSGLLIYAVFRKREDQVPVVAAGRE